MPLQLAVILPTYNERGNLRSLVARLDAALAGIACGLALLYGAGAALAPWLASQHGLQLSLGWPSAGEWRLLAAVLVASLLASLVPALRAYRYSLADGMTIRV